MDLMSSSFLPGDPRMVDQIVYELKSQGIFDQFRKECIADVDTKPAYQNLRQRVEGSVMNFLKKRKFASDTNKNQLREQLRKNITESGFLESGVERIVDQVVNPKISSVFLPKVEEVVYRFLGIQKPESASTSQDDKVKTEDLLPTDLEAVSPESVHETSKVSAAEISSENVDSGNNETNNTSLTKTDDESPPFEPLEENTKFSMQEDNSVDSRYSGASGNDSVLEASNQPMNISENSQINGNSNMAGLSEDVKMDICDNTMASENSDKLEIVEESKHKSDSSKRSHDKNKSSKSDKHREESKDKRERSKSESKSKDKSISRHSSSSSKDKDKKDEPSEKEFNLEKYKIPKKDESDKNKDKKKSEKSGDRDKSSSKDQSDKSSRERTKSEKDRHDKEKSSSHKSKERSSSSSKKDDKDRKHRDERDDKSSKDKSSSSSKSSSRNKESSSKDKSSKDKPKSSSSSKDKSSDSKKTHEDSKSSKRDKHKGHESSSKKDKEKSASDDHYSFKNKKRERRSTDRDSNDGSGKTNRSETLVDSTSENSSKSSKKGTSENFSSGGDSSSNSDKVEKCNETEEVAASTNVVHVEPIKYIKPKFASNMEEAMKIMKIRKQLAKLERKNQLTLLQIPQQTELTSEEYATEPQIASEVPATEVEEDTPVLKSQDLSMESFEALEARLAQEMSNIGDHVYGDEDDENYESSAISVHSNKKRKIDTDDEFDAGVSNAEIKVKFNGGFVHTENTTITKSDNFSDKENHIIENSVSQIPKRKVSEEFTGFTAAERKCSEEIMKKSLKAYSQYITGNTGITQLATTPKTNDNRLFIKLDKMDLKQSAEVKTKQNGEISATVEAEEPCYFFQKESLMMSQKRLAVLNSYVVRLEQNLEEETSKIRKNVSHVIKRGLKRKLQGTENNNSLNCNYKPPTKRNHLSNANSNETVCNTNVSSHPDFSLPLSPAESEKSGENKKEEPVMVKPKRVSGSATKRYSSADLYKPRPVLSGSTTRRRTARNLLESPKP